MCIGCMGSIGSQVEAIKIENTFPELELATILMYLIVLSWVMRPHTTPATNIYQYMDSFSSNISMQDNFVALIKLSMHSSILFSSMSLVASVSWCKSW